MHTFLPQGSHLAELINVKGVPYYKDRALHWSKPLQVPLAHLARACVLAEICRFSSDELKKIAEGGKVEHHSIQTLGWSKDLAVMVVAFYLTQLLCQRGSITGDEAFTAVVEEIEELKQLSV